MSPISDDRRDKRKFAIGHITQNAFQNCKKALKAVYRLWWGVLPRRHVLLMNVVFRDIKPQFVLHRRHITSRYRVQTVNAM
jgi:hypothetical protein